MSLGFTPKLQRTIHNTAQPVANTDIMPVTSHTSEAVSMFVLGIAMSSAGILSVTITNGGNTQSVTLNGGAALTAGALHIFKILVDIDDEINFQYSVTGGTIQIFRLQEIWTN